MDFYIHPSEPYNIKEYLPNLYESKKKRKYEKLYIGFGYIRRNRTPTVHMYNTKLKYIKRKKKKKKKRKKTSIASQDFSLFHFYISIK